MSKKGFTLVEILIVLVVAGILLALILPNTLKAIDRGNITADQTNVNTLQTAVFMCYTENRDWTLCDTQGELESDGFLDIGLVSPYSGGSYTFTSTQDNAGNTIGIKVTSSEQGTRWP